MTKPTCILALDATGGACSAALWSGGEVRARRLEVMERGQSERLVPMIQEVVGAAGVGFGQLSLVAVTTGPGGFTGVRIGLATARALGLACACPVIGVTAFEAAAAALGSRDSDDKPLVALIESKRAELYGQVLGETPGRPFSLAPAQLDPGLPPGPLLLVGDGAPRAREALENAGRRGQVTCAATGPIDAAAVACLAASRPAPAPGTPPPGPLYLRAPDVTLPGDDRP